VIETNQYSRHLAGIIPLAGPPLDFNMPWHDSMIPINSGYHAVERAINTAALAGCNTIWVILHREAQPLIRKKIGEWIYDPESIWKGYNVFFNKIEVPIYYVCVNPIDRYRRDSLAWSSLYGAKVASYISAKISKWVLPKKFLVVSPYGISNDETIKNCREILRSDKNIAIINNSKTFLDNIHSPFSFSQKEYEECRKNFKQKYTGDETRKTFGEVFESIKLESYDKIEADWFYNISSWEGYRQFLSSQHNILCQRPKYMVNHEWWGLVKDT